MQRGCGFSSPFFSIVSLTAACRVSDDSEVGRLEARSLSRLRLTSLPPPAARPLHSAHRPTPADCFPMCAVSIYTVLHVDPVAFVPVPRIDESFGPSGATAKVALTTHHSAPQHSTTVASTTLAHHSAPHCTVCPPVSVGGAAYVAACVVSRLYVSLRADRCEPQ